MVNRSVVIRRRSSRWDPQTKTKIQTKHEINTSGFISPVVIVVVFAVFAALSYVYSINQSAVKGFRIKTIEKEISQLRKENESLKIREAELRSLHRIEQFSRDLNMAEADEVVFLDGSNQLALYYQSK